MGGMPAPGPQHPESSGPSPSDEEEGGEQEAGGGALQSVPRLKPE